MKAVFISYNQAFHESIIRLLDRNGIRGYTYWETVQGRGSKTGEPHYGNHAWPTLNSSILTIVDEEKAKLLLSLLKKMDTETEALGLRAFQWNIETTI